MAIVKQGSTTLNAGAKGDKGDVGVGGGGIALPVTNLAELQAITSNQIASIQGDIDLATTTVNIPSGVTLRFEGGSIINGTLNGADTYIWAEEVIQIFDLTTVFTGTFKFRACYPEWFGGKGDGVTENILYFAKTIEFIDTSGGGVIELWGDVYNFSSQSANGAWDIGYTNGGKEPIIEVHSNTHIVSYVSSKLKVVDAAVSEFDIHPILSITDNVLTLDTTVGTQEKSPQNGELVYINDNYIGRIGTKSTPNYPIEIDTVDINGDTVWTAGFNPDSPAPQIGDMFTVVTDSNYKLLKFHAAKNSSIKGVVMEGNREILKAAGYNYNHGSTHCVVFYGDCYNVTIDDNEILNIPSDAFNGSYEGNFGGNALELYEDGTINSETGAIEVDPDGLRVRSEISYRIDSAKIIENDRFMIFDQYAYQQINSLPRGKFSIFYYRDSGAYLGCRLNQEMYEHLAVLKDGNGFPADYVKLVIENNDDARFDIPSATGGEQVIPVGAIRAGVRLRASYPDYVWVDDVLLTEGAANDYTWTETPDVESILNLNTPLVAGQKLVVSFGIYRVMPRAIEVPTKINIINNTFHDLGRQGVSITGFQDLLIDNNICFNVYGSPGAFVDAEDGEWLNRRLTISNNTVWSCRLGVHLYSTSRVKIIGNKFKKADDEFYGTRLQLRSVISFGAPGGNIIVSNNFFEYASLVLWKGVVFADNTLEFCRADIIGGNVSNNQFNSSSLTIAQDLSEPDAVGQMNIENNIFTTRPNFEDIWHSVFGMDAVLESKQTPSYFKNNMFRGETNLNPAQFKEGLIVENVVFTGTVTQPLINSATVNGLICDTDVDILYVPKDNEYVTYKNWDIKSSGADIQFRGATTNLHHFIFDNLTIESTSTSPQVFDVNENLGSLVIKNSSLIGRSSTNTSFNLINFDKTVTKFRMFNTEVVTATAGNLLDKGTSTEDVTWIYKDNVFTNVVLNNTLGTELNNIEE